MFETLLYRLDKITTFLPGNVMQIAGLGLDNDAYEIKNDCYQLYKGCISYEENFLSGKENPEEIIIARASGYDVNAKVYEKNGISDEDRIRARYLGDVVLVHEGWWESNHILLLGTYNANTLLRNEKLEKEGYVSFFDVEEERVQEITDQIKKEANKDEIYGYYAEDSIYYASELYFWLTGKPCTYADGSVCLVQSLEDLRTEDLRYILDDCWDYGIGRSEWGDEYVFYQIDMVEDYY